VVDSVSGHDDGGTGDDDPEGGTDGDAGTDESVGRSDAGTDLPADVEATLGQLLAEAAAAARRREVDEVTAIVDTVETVVRTKVPAGDLRERLEHGCTTVERLVADEPLVAAEYLNAMERRVRSPESSP
jgi:hypothetical protein